MLTSPLKEAALPTQARFEACLRKWRIDKAGPIFAWHGITEKRKEIRKARKRRNDPSL